MASNATATLLTSAQRLTQIQLRDVTAADLRKLWPAFDPTDISGSWNVIEPLLVQLIQSRRPLSATIAANYLDSFRDAEDIPGTAKPVLDGGLTADEIIPNLRLLGPSSAKRLASQGDDDSLISSTTFSNVEGEMSRQILNGGRQTILDTVSNDSQAVGYSRVSDGDPCAFCAMLCGRGAVYNSEESGSFEAHRNCYCSAEPVYSSDQPLSASAQQYADVYRQAAKAVPKSTSDWSAAVRREFRRQYTAS